MSKPVAGRRNVLRSAAWSVPVVAFAAAAPAASASTPASLVIFSSVSAYYASEGDGAYNVHASAAGTLTSGNWPSGTTMVFVFDGQQLPTTFTLGANTISGSRVLLVFGKPWTTCAAAVYANGTLLGQSAPVTITG